MATNEERKLAALIKYFSDEAKGRADGQDDKIELTRADISVLKERMAKLEGQHEYVREDVTGMHRIPDLSKMRRKSDHPKKDEGKSALEVLKVIGPWILAGIALITLLVRELIARTQ